jgi:hypothetical protein
MLCSARTLEVINRLPKNAAMLSDFSFRCDGLTVSQLVYQGAFLKSNDFMLIESNA